MVQATAALSASAETSNLQARFLAAFRWMLLARTVEEKLSSLYRGGKITGGVFLGKGQEALSAATGMVVVSTLTLSLMIGNHWFAPGLLRGAWSRDKGGDRRGDLLLLRRGGILVIMLLAWAYSRFNSGNDALADIGAVSFSALGTLAPALGFAVWRPQTPPRAAIIGIAAGFSAWAWGCSDRGTRSG